jgi:ribonuclease III family protein
MNPSEPVPHPRALAHLGDAVYELWIREAAITQFQKNVDLHRFTASRVKAQTQCQLLERILPTLNTDLEALVKRAQNIPVPVGRRSSQAVYRKATAFEALVGYWYLYQPDALEEYKAQIFRFLNEILVPESC